MTVDLLQLPQPLVSGTLIRRYNRFLADIRLEDGTTVTAHCPSSGTMKTCSEPSSPALISRSDNPKRKLAYTLELIHAGDAWVGVNTMTPNRAVAALIEGSLIPQLAGYRAIRREVRYGTDNRSRIDLLLTEACDGRPNAYVEVKNTTLRDGAYCEFPDAVTERGRKHLADLEQVVAEGHRGIILFFVGRSDCTRFRPADTVDPAYGAALRRAIHAGVEAIAWQVRFEPPAMVSVGALPVDLDSAGL
jgi:sugar fermentation stimulation protein A